MSGIGFSWVYSRGLRARSVAASRKRAAMTATPLSEKSTNRSRHVASTSRKKRT